MPPDALADLLAALRNPAVYPHAAGEAGEVIVVETHVSFVLLAGEHAYKLKKPLDLGFLDYSTLRRRRSMCHEEVRRNARLAPQVYEGVVAITGTARAPRLRDDPPPAGETAFEYAVRMKRFPQTAQLDRRLAAGALDVADMERIADCVAGYQATAARVASDGEYGTPACVLRPVHENFAQILPRLGERAADLRERLGHLRTWATAEHARLTPLLACRRAGGFVRACHGDLHLANLAEIDGRVVAFDCIEFDPGLYWIDVVSDTAFLVMDLLARGRRDLAATFLDAWLLRTGDYDGLRLLPFHLAYRSMVRAKVAAIAMTQREGDARRPHLERLREHVALAARVAPARGGALVILCGLAGSGKSTLARELVREYAALSVHSDVERKRLFGIAPEAASGSPPDGGIYTPDANRRTYERLAAAAAAIARSGHVAVVDACFLRRRERERFHALAAELGVPSVVLLQDVPHDELLRRVAARAAAGGDHSEAGTDVVRRQIATAQLPRPNEAHCVTVRRAATGEDDVVGAALAALDAHRGGTP